MLVGPRYEGGETEVEAPLAAGEDLDFLSLLHPVLTLIAAKRARIVINFTILRLLWFVGIRRLAQSLVVLIVP